MAGLLCAMLSSGLGSCGAFSTGELVRLRDVALTREVFRLGAWCTNFDKARALSKSRGVPILAYFSRSYAECPGCIRIERELLSTPAFLEMCESVVLFAHMTAAPRRLNPVPGDDYPWLLFDKGFTAVPTVCIMDGDGEVVCEPRLSLPGIQKGLDRSRRLFALRAGESTGKVSDSKMAFVTELELDLLSEAEIRLGVDRWDLSACEQALVSAKLVDTEVRQVLRRQKEGMLDGSPSAYLEGSSALYLLAKSGRVPSETTALVFWQATLEHCARVGDAVLGRAAYDALMREVEGERDAWPAWRLGEWSQQLERAGGR